MSPTIFPDGSYGTLENGLSGISLTPTNVSGNGLVFRGVQLHYQTPYTEGFNLMLQYSLTPQDSIQAGYVGSVGRHLEAFAGTNHPTQILPPGTPITPYIAFPDFAADASYDITAGSTSYNSLQTKYERRFSHGFNMLAGYTWQRTLTDAGDLLSNGGVGGFRAPQIAGISYDRGLASFNINHSFVASGTYQLPFGQGKAFLGNLHGPGAAVAWRLDNQWDPDAQQRASTGNSLPDDDNGRLGLAMRTRCPGSAGIVRAVPRTTTILQHLLIRRWRPPSAPAILPRWADRTPRSMVLASAILIFPSSRSLR